MVISGSGLTACQRLGSYGPLQVSFKQWLESSSHIKIKVAISRFSMSNYTHILISKGMNSPHYSKLDRVHIKVYEQAVMNYSTLEKMRKR